MMKGLNGYNINKSISARLMQMAKFR